MLEKTRNFGKDCILHDAQIARAVTPEWFRPDYWRERRQWTPVPGGRGEGARIGEGGQWFLRHYLRGGKAALVSRDRYLFLGAGRVRPFAEFRLLASMREAGLPVPRPIAASYRRSGLSYTADLITEWIAEARTLPQALGSASDPSKIMARVGSVLARFHRAGIAHADLNANNILIAADSAVWLLDFDRARRRRPGNWRHARLNRLKRSLKKLSLYDPDTFQALLDSHNHEYTTRMGLPRVRGGA